MVKVSDEMSWIEIYRTAWSGARYAAERLQEEGKGEETGKDPDAGGGTETDASSPADAGAGTM